MKRVCKPGGTILITTGSFGMPYHAWPYDFWRYETQNMEVMFSDCEILALEKDTGDPGVFLKARKPMDFVEVDLPEYALYSIVSGNRCVDISPKDVRTIRYTRLKYRVILERTCKPVILKLMRSCSES